MTGSFNPQLKVLNVMFNQTMAFCRFLLTDRQSSLGHTLQRIEVVQINVVQLVKVRIDVTRYRQIDHEEWSMPASSQERR
jgi:hypothetical protein